MRLGLVLLSAGVFVVNLDATVVAIALPEIGRTLGDEITDLQWVVNGYVLAVACLLLGIGSLGDSTGRKRVYLTGLVGFAATSVACALAPSVGLLIAARVAQGVFGAALLAVTLALVADMFPDPPARARAIGLLAGCSTLAVAIGPVLGGLLVAQYGWQSAFWINVPVALVTVPALAVLLPSGVRRGGRFDVAGQILFAFAATALTFGLIEGNRQGWGSVPIVAALGAGAVALCGFVAVQRRSPDPMLPLALVRRQAVAIGCAINFLGFFTLLPTLFLMTLYLQDTAGLSALEAGVRFLALTGTLTLVSLFAPSAATRWGTRPVVVAGAILAAVGFAGLALIRQETGYSGFWWALALVGLGVPMLLAPATIAALGAAPAGYTATTTSIVTTFRQLGAVVGVAVAGFAGMSATFTAAAGAALVCGLLVLPREAPVSARISR